MNVWKHTRISWLPADAACRAAVFFYQSALPKGHLLFPLLLARFYSVVRLLCTAWRMLHQEVCVLAFKRDF
jgi:hypothetical protein